MNKIINLIKPYLLIGIIAPLLWIGITKSHNHYENLVKSEAQKSQALEVAEIEKQTLIAGITHNARMFEAKIREDDKLRQEYNELRREIRSMNIDDALDKAMEEGGNEKVLSTVNNELSGLFAGAEAASDYSAIYSSPLHKTDRASTGNSAESSN